MPRMEQRLRTVAVIGAGQCGHQTSLLAESLGRLLAETGFSVVCGGLSGVMEAACKGARSAGGLTIGILPGTDRATANAYVDIPIATGLGQMRNSLVVRNGFAVVAVEGGNGTLSEVGLALKAEIPVVAIGRWSELPGVLPARDASEAVTLIRKMAPFSA
ncbi:hypothetical protein SAMN02745704_01194 [Paucidesulfovibrio gracilis DSM 16080]|uniref:TIGR00725 family protein n=1 Tax=Paucidesulfovibrio gracilis DSM 16080 TaxID=1121449 RepID=A0A1T4WN60_9BACT|nr:hypothetical protein SAMN02745704_01194 [Paucidesulfovibrio gracilis DSM 16080]